MRAQQYNQTDLCRPITALEKCQGTDKNYVPTGSLITIMFLPVQAQRSFEMKKAPLLRRAALKNDVHLVIVVVVFLSPDKLKEKKLGSQFPS